MANDFGRQIVNPGIIVFFFERCQEKRLVNDSIISKRNRFTTIQFANLYRSEFVTSGNEFKGIAVIAAKNVVKLFAIILDADDIGLVVKDLK
jgi:inosine/xanthosine triphosphate pyrophosphatase family protein